MLFRHKKTGNLYLTYDDHVINATNSVDESQNRMVLYSACASAQMYVREYSEFMQKFELVLDDNSKSKRTKTKG